jgi:hypothetical protein
MACPWPDYERVHQQEHGRPRQATRLLWPDSAVKVRLVGSPRCGAIHPGGHGTRKDTHVHGKSKSDASGDPVVNDRGRAMTKPAPET